MAVFSIRELELPQFSNLFQGIRGHFYLFQKIVLSYTTAGHKGGRKTWCSEAESGWIWTEVTSKQLSIFITESTSLRLKTQWSWITVCIYMIVKRKYERLKVTFWPSNYPCTQEMLICALGHLLFLFLFLFLVVVSYNCLMTRRNLSFWWYWLDVLPCTMYWFYKTKKVKTIKISRFR